MCSPALRGRVIGVTNNNRVALRGRSKMSKILFGIVVVCIVVAQCGQLKKSEITVDDTLKVALVNNVISDADAERVFNYAKSSLYDDEKYKEAKKAFEVVKNHSSSEWVDDSMYYIGKINYHHYRDKGYVEMFREVYNSFPDGSIAGSGLLSETLLDIINNGSIEENFKELMQIYSLLTRVDPAKKQQAEQIVQRKISQNLATPEKNEVFTVPCSYRQTQEYRLKYLALDQGWDYKLWQVENDINSNGDLTRDWKKGALEKIRESAYQSALEKIVDQFEYTTNATLHSETRDKIRHFIEGKSRLEYSVIAKNITIRGISKPFVVIDCCVFCEISLDTIAKLANIDLFEVAGPAASESI
jgi:hypothetical protein